MGALLEEEVAERVMEEPGVAVYFQMRLLTVRVADFVDEVIGNLLRPEAEPLFLWETFSQMSCWLMLPLSGASHFPSLHGNKFLSLSPSLTYPNMLRMDATSCQSIEAKSVAASLEVPVLNFSKKMPWLNFPLLCPSFHPTGAVW